MPETSTPTRRRRLVLGLSGLMLAVLVIGGGIGWVAYRARVQREAVEAIERVHGEWSYSIDILSSRWLHRWPFDALGPEYLGHLDFISLKRGADDDLMARIARLGRLSQLNLDGNRRISGEGLARVSGLDGLRVLRVHDTGIDGPSLVHLRVMTDLEELSLPDDVSDADLAHISGLTSLRELTLSGHTITDAGLAHLARLTNLWHLKIRCPGVKGPGLAHLRGLAKLERLDLDKSGVDSLAALPPVPRLEVLLLPGTPLDDAGLAPVAALPSLSWLALSDTRITDAGLDHLAGLPRLDFLQLDGTRVTDAGLSRLSRLPRLTDLWLDRTAITDAGAESLAGLVSLTYLNLKHTPIMDAALPRLRTHPRCRIFILDDTKVTPAGLASFKAAQETKTDAAP